MATRNQCARCLRQYVPIDRSAALTIEVRNGRGTVKASLSLCDLCAQNAVIKIVDRELVFETLPEAIKREPVRDFSTINDIAAQACGIGSAK